jgi:hypothetical protein
MAVLRKKRLLVVFVDALGPEQAELLQANAIGLPHRRSLEGILGYSCAALPTILTGQKPEVHGRMCTFRQGTGDDSVLRPLKWLGLLPKILHERSTVRRAAASALKRAHSLDGYLDLYKVPPSAFDWIDVAEREDLFQAPEIGGARTFLADARDAGLRVDASPWQIPEARRFAEAAERARRAPADLTFLYATELDGVMHADGASSPRARDAAARIANGIDGVRSRLARGADLTTLVVGDHGMADVRAVVDPRPLTDRSHSLRFFVDSTFLRMWGDAATLASTRARFEALRMPGKWLAREDLQAREAPVEGSPYGDAIVVLPEGSVFAPSFVGGIPRGMHGYDRSERSARAALLSDAALPETCTSLASVASVVRASLGLAACVEEAK